MAVTTTVYFGFVVNAIAKKMNITGAYAGGNKRGGGLAEPEYGLGKKLGAGFFNNNLYGDIYGFNKCI